MTNLQYLEYLASSSYRPADEQNWLNDWDGEEPVPGYPELGMYPEGWGDKPVSDPQPAELRTSRPATRTRVTCDYSRVGACDAASQALRQSSQGPPLLWLAARLSIACVRIIRYGGSRGATPRHTADTSASGSRTLGSGSTQRRAPTAAPTHGETSSARHTCRRSSGSASTRPPPTSTLTSPAHPLTVRPTLRLSAAREQSSRLNAVKNQSSNE